MGEIPEAIQNATADICGEAELGRISKQPNTLRVSRPDLPDLTLVDLPGLVATAGPDQPDDIVEQIRSMVHSYISVSGPQPRACLKDSAASAAPCFSPATLSS